MIYETLAAAEAAFEAYFAHRLGFGRSAIVAAFSGPTMIGWTIVRVATV